MTATVWRESTEQSGNCSRSRQTQEQVLPFLNVEIRKSELSYKLLLVQRNKYICFMAIFTSLALNIYVSLLRYLYQKRDHFELKKSMVQARTSVGDPSKRNSLDSAAVGEEDPAKKNL